MISLTATELNRFIRCPGSYYLTSVKINKETNRDAEEGNAVHWFVQQVFEGNFTAEELIDRKAPNGIFITADMFEYASEYLNAIMGKGFVEYDTSYSQADYYEVRGRADHLYYDEESKTLYVSDYKHGWGIVEPSENWTLISHAYGFLQRNTHLQGLIEKVIFRIFQPRPYHYDGPVRSDILHFEQFLSLVQKLVMVLSRHEKQVVVGPQCYKCPKMTNCPAEQKAVAASLEIAENAFDSEMSNEALSITIKTVSRAMNNMKQFLTACEDLALQRLSDGQKIKDFHIDKQYGYRAWKENVNADLIKMVSGVDVSKTTIVSPAEAVRRGITEDMVSTFTEKPYKGVKLVEADEAKRYEKMFGKKGS